MSFTTDDLGRQFNETVGGVAKLARRGVDSYEAAAYGGYHKAGVVNYAAQVSAQIAGDARIVSIFNQGTQQSTTNRRESLVWLDRDDTFWVHCYSNNIQQSRFRVYVCTALAHTHTVLRQLLQGYNGSLYFKVAAHAEAQIRNDTIVSWHPNIQDAHQWGAIAQANVGLLDGTAPAGTFGAFARSIGIDTEVQGDTSTSRIARGVDQENADQRQKRILNNPYI